MKWYENNDVKKTFQTLPACSTGMVTGQLAWMHRSRVGH
jgi:hypothetical protein